MPEDYRRAVAAPELSDDASTGSTTLATADHIVIAGPLDDARSSDPTQER